ASLGEPDAYPSFPDFSAGAPAFGDGGLGFGSPGEPLGFASGDAPDFLTPPDDGLPGFGSQDTAFDMGEMSADDDPFAMPGAPVFPAVMETEEAAPIAAVDDDPFAMPGAPVFPAVMETEEAAPVAAVDDDPFAMPGAPVFPAVMETEEAASVASVDDDPFAMPGAPVFPAVKETEETVEPTMASEPVVEQVHTVPVAQKPLVEESQANASHDSAALSASAMHEVVLKSAEERKQLHAQVNEIVSTLNHQLDEVQTTLAFLYAELQKAAVRRASVGDLMGITEQISHSRQRVGLESEAYKQALYLRQVADAYMALMQEL
ncbi:MAG: hypothetical protein VKN33_08780, partial [Candidatus Sericytochromatia bacterium]|nr:hypothetical protein [Candidatus Sericytochromatia bacterium]